MLEECAGVEQAGVSSTSKVASERIARKSIAFVVTNEALYVANKGKPFDRRGVVSIGREHLSAKTLGGPKDLFAGVPDRQLAKAIREQRLRTYKGDTDQLQEDANQEAETSKDYRGRALWELLQNADDALAPAGASSADLIGAKGLGFKSVLELTDKPSIHSARFDFGFDRDRSHALLSKIVSDPPPLTFRLPHDVQRDEPTSELIKRGYATVIRLPFRSEAERTEIASRLALLDPRFLLLSHNLRQIEISVAGAEPIRYSASRPTGGNLRNADARLEREIGGSTTEEAWKIWSRHEPAPDETSKSLSAAIAVRLFNGVPGPCDDDLPLHVFFPTNERIGTRFLVHASFSLTSNRNNLRADRYDQRIRDLLSSLAQETAQDLPPSSTIRLFSDLVEQASGRKAQRLDRQIQQAMAKSVRETEFVKLIGGGRARPGDVRTWDHDVDEVVSRASARALWLPVAELQDDFAALRNVFDAEALRAADYASILAAAKCQSTDQCLRALRIARVACLSTWSVAPLIPTLKSARIWPKADGGTRALNSDVPFLYSRPKGWPTWLTADELDPSAKTLLEDGEENDRSRWKVLIEGSLLRDSPDWVGHALVPVLARWSEEDWQAKGYDALERVHDWAKVGEFSEIQPLIPANGPENIRDRISRVARVPSRRGWVSSRSCYASRDIGGIPELAAFFKTVPNRSIAGMPREANVRFGPDRWRSLLRYLGVSWEPKLRRVPKDGTLYGEGGYYRFINAVQESQLLHIECEWRIENFPECLDKLSASQVARCVSTLEPVVRHVEGRWRKIEWATKTHPPRPFRSFADFQLKRERYQRASRHTQAGRERFAASELFWPGRGLPGITPILDLGTNNRLRQAGLKALFVDRLGVRDSLPQDWREWRTWCDALIARVEEGHPPSAKALRAFYDGMLRQRMQVSPDQRPKRLAVLDERAPSGIGLFESGSVVWIDHARFDSPEIHQGLSDLEIGILPVLLDRGAAAPNLLGVRRASELLSVEADYREAPVRASERLAAIIRARRGALAAICETKGQYLRDLPEVLAVHDLRLRISFSGKQLNERTASAFRVGDGWLINLQSEIPEALAMAIAEPFGFHAPDLKHRFARVLRASRAEVPALLAEDGIPSYRIREALAADGPIEENDEGGGESEAAESNEPAHAAGDVGDDDIDFDVTDDGLSDEDDTESDTDADETTDDSKAKSSGSAKTSDGTLTRRSLFGSAGAGADKTKNKRSAAEAAESAARKGLQAEDWLLRKVTSVLGRDWRCTRWVRDEGLRETDLVLTRGKKEWHLEVKSLSSERLYWSELEREKAGGLPGRYFMALLIENGDNYDVRWSFDPLKELVNLERRIDWVWSATKEGPSLRHGWELEPGLRSPTQRATRYIHVVRVTNEDLPSFEIDDDQLTRLRVAIGDLK